MLRRRELLTKLWHTAEAGVFGAIVGTGIENSISGKPGWASRRFDVSEETGEKIESHTTHVAAISAGVMTAATWFAWQHSQSQSNSKEPNPAEGDPRPLRGPSPGAS